MAAQASAGSDYTALFHEHYNQIRALQRDSHSALQARAKGRRRADRAEDEGDALAGVVLSKRELEVYNRLLNDEGG